MTQAPSVNLDTAMMIRTMKESTAAVPLMASRRRQWSSRWFRWYLAMPAPAMVKPVNTPMAYSGISLSTLALVIHEQDDGDHR